MIFLKKLLPSLALCIFPVLSIAQPIDLMTAYKRALQHDADIHAAYNQLLSSKEASPQALAGLLPSINASALSNDVRQESESSFSGTGKSTDQFRDEGFAVSLRQPLFNWANYTRYKQANKQVSRAEVEYEIAQQALILRLTERYLNSLQAEVALNLANDDVNAFTRQLEQAQARFEVGLIAITDVHNAQARYDLSIATQIAAQDDLYSAQESLREIIQTDELVLAHLASSFPLSAPEPNDINRWEEFAALQNLSLEVAKYDVNIAKKEIELQRAGHYPTVDLVASHQYAETGGGSFGTGLRNESDSIGVELNVPLFAGGRTSSLTRQAAFNHQQSLDILQSLQRTTLRKTRDAFRGVTTNLKRIHALEQAIVSNKSSLDANEVGLEVGTRTIVDVLDAQSNLSRAKLELSIAKKDYILNILNLKNNAGTLSEADLSIVNNWLAH
ncbi:TolC family outer membrane protein [Cycloclasticus pugetii]|uniref:TolC family outer membrane protein n=1 Tax=Cycloclasticus pugetii TaxID=34068 RepID=UPI000912EB38|nr:TolC family outer membrane protein [Cycloclasticus pugetii]SHJ18506.1 outer membrane protein [Cycloclasticus pugetii]